VIEQKPDVTKYIPEFHADESTGIGRPRPTVSMIVFFLVAFGIPWTTWIALSKNEAGCLSRRHNSLPGERRFLPCPSVKCVGKDKLTKPEAVRKGAEVVASLGVSTEDHLQRR
jgi:hypothetical protein